MAQSTVKKVIAVVSKNPVLKDAIAALLTPRMDNTEFVHYDKLSAVPEEIDTVAHMGVPGFPLEGRKMNILSFSTDYSDDAATREAYRDIVNSPASSVADICDVLSKPKRFAIVPQAVAAKVNMEFQTLRADAAEADDLQVKLDKTIAQRDLALSITPLG